MLGLTPFGTFHTAISLIAVAAGLIALVRDQEISPKNRVGKIYVLTTIITCLTGFGIFHHGGFGKPHVLGIMFASGTPVEAMASVSARRKLLRIRSASGDLDGKPAISVEVIDNGTGFSNKDTERLFEAFYTSKPEGMGMGLWISRSIIEAHGGRLSALINDGSGATFRIVLPVNADSVRESGSA